MATETVKRLPNMDDLRAFDVPPSAEDTVIFVEGYYNPNDGGGGFYRYDSTSALAPNDGTVVVPNEKLQETGGVVTFNDGRWLLNHKGVVTVRHFGAIGSALGSNPTTLRSQIDDFGGTRFTSEGHVKAIYAAVAGGPFSGLRLGALPPVSDTVDWAAIQIAVLWCGENGVRLEVPTGVYRFRRPLWIGDDTTVLADLTKEPQDKDVRALGFTMTGQACLSRWQSDDDGANFHLTQNCRNRYVLSKPQSGTASFKLGFRKIGANGQVSFEYTSELTASSTAAQVAQAVETALEALYTPTTFTVVADVPDTGLSVSAQNVYFVVTGGTDEFLGEIQVLALNGTGDVGPYEYRYRCYPDSGIVSFRRSAAHNYHVSDLTLRGNDNTSSFDRFATFGLVHVTSQFVGHVLERIYVNSADIAYGILQGTGENGEAVRFSGLVAEECWKGVFLNAPQAFGHHFEQWRLLLDNQRFDAQHEATGPPGIVAEFGQMPKPGVNVNFTSLGATFYVPPVIDDNTNGKGILVKCRRGTGIVQFVGGRVEHMATLFDYDAVDGQNLKDNLDMIVRGVEFDGMKGGSDRNFVNGFIGVGGGTQYGLFVDTCKFLTKGGLSASAADLFMATSSIDGLRCVFTNCRFEGIRSFVSQNFRGEFVRCYKNDFGAAGEIGTPLRLFEQAVGTPGPRTQSLRTAWQDTPWIQTGSRVNVLKNSDLAGQTMGLNETAGPTGGITLDVGGDWNSTTGKIGGFAKWAGLSGGNAVLSDFSPAPESFFLSLRHGEDLRNALTEVDLSGTGFKVVTFQALVRVSKAVEFRLEDTASTPAVYDKVILSGGDDVQKSPWTLVTLRLQVDQNLAVDPRLVFSNAFGSGAARLQVMWMQAWWGSSATGAAFPLDRGLANAGHRRYVSGAVVDGAYTWAVNALSVKASGRLQLPLLDTAENADAEAMGWRSAISASSYDLQDGETYYDSDQEGVLLRGGNGWHILYQPERFARETGSSFTWDAGSEKNVIMTGTGGKTLTLPASRTNLANGTVIRIYNFGSSGDITLANFALSNNTVSVNTMWELIYDRAADKWVVTQQGVAARQS